jgi:hypothetical protein
MTLEITSFIQGNIDWEEKLSESPYCIKLKRHGGFILLKYNQFDSDFNLPLVRECRGIILDETNNYLPVCIPFFKFGNFGESYVPEIDWHTASVQEKLDGSLIKLWNYKGKWYVSSNGEIDARNAQINSALLTGNELTDLFTLFTEAWDKTGVSMDTLDKDLTYMFELTSPHNRIVVKYNDVSIRHIGARSNSTFLEHEVDIGVPKPKTYPLKSLDECIESAKRMSYGNEGYVIVDSFFNRTKVKSPLYVALNHMVQGTTTRGNIVEIIQKNEQDEFLIYFPEYHDVFREVLKQIESFSAKQDALFKDIDANTFESRKALAEIVTKTECPACLFALYDKKAADAKSWLMSRPIDKILSLI